MSPEADQELEAHCGGELMADPETLAEAQLRTIEDLTGMGVVHFAQQASSPPAVGADGPVQLAVGRV